MDADWHYQYGPEAKRAFQGRIAAPHVKEGVEYREIKAGNSGAGAILLAAELGAREIILLGYDCQHTGGRAHWHADHPSNMGNAGNVHKWADQFAEVARKLPAGVKVINATRSTALTVWPTAQLEEVLNMPAPPLNIKGMHGMGDCLYQRAIVRQHMRAHEVFLQTPWPELYHDLRGPRLKLIKPETRLRTQAKNIARAEFDNVRVPTAPTIDVRYPPAAVRQHRGVLAAMAAQCGVPGANDFALPVPDDWQHGLDLPAGRPVILYRPLVVRKEWSAASRNPEAGAYVAVLQAVRERLGAHAVSVADLEPGKEWITSPDIGADLELHAGELDIKGLAALTRDAALVFAAPGFAVVMAQAVGAPCISMFGGYQMAYTLPDSSKILKIDPDSPCDCFTHTHGCGQVTNIERAKRQALEFVERECLLKN